MLGETCPTMVIVKALSVCAAAISESKSVDSPKSATLGDMSAAMRTLPDLRSR